MSPGPVLWPVVLMMAPFILAVGSVSAGPDGDGGELVGE
jgi:hypothetical protein